jgi:predicted dinucleotide-binding enzyme
MMRIGIIGAGRIRGTLARLLAEAGHEVAISNSRGPETLKTLTDEIGKGVRAETAAHAGAFGDIIVVAIPFGRYAELPSTALVGKVVVDANNYYPQRDGQFQELDAGDTTSSELLQAHVPNSRVVKAFNTINYRVLAGEGKTAVPVDERLVVFLAGDDAEAKSMVGRLIEEIGFAAIDTGSLPEGGRRQQPGSPIYTKPMNTVQAREILDAGW